MKYVIIDSQSLTPDMLRSANANDIKNVRANTTGTKVILKFEMKNHAAFLGMDWLSHDQVTEILKSSEWDSSHKTWWQQLLGFFGLN